MSQQKPKDPSEGDNWNIHSVPRLSFTLEEWQALVGAIKPDGETADERRNRFKLQAERERYLREKERRSFWITTALAVILTLFCGGVLTFSDDAQSRNVATTLLPVIWSGWLGYLAGKHADGGDKGAG
jgi:hypothetical protein